MIDRILKKKSHKITALIQCPHITQFSFNFQKFSANSNATFEGLDYGPLYTITAEPPGTSQENIMTTWVQIAWTGVFGGMILTATGGNCIVIWIVIGKIGFVILNAVGRGCPGKVVMCTWLCLRCANAGNNFIRGSGAVVLHVLM